MNLPARPLVRVWLPRVAPREPAAWGQPAGALVAAPHPAAEAAFRAAGVPTVPAPFREDAGFLRAAEGAATTLFFDVASAVERAIPERAADPAAARAFWAPGRYALWLACCHFVEYTVMIEKVTRASGAGLVEIVVADDDWWQWLFLYPGARRDPARSLLAIAGRAAAERVGVPLGATSGVPGAESAPGAPFPRPSPRPLAWRAADRVIAALAARRRGATGRPGLLVYEGFYEGRAILTSRAVHRAADVALLTRRGDLIRWRRGMPLAARDLVVRAASATTGGSGDHPAAPGAGVAFPVDRAPRAEEFPATGADVRALLTAWCFDGLAHALAREGERCHVVRRRVEEFFGGGPGAVYFSNPPQPGEAAAAAAWVVAGERALTRIGSQHGGLYGWRASPRLLRTDLDAFDLWLSYAPDGGRFASLYGRPVRARIAPVGSVELRRLAATARRGRVTSAGETRRLLYGMTQDNVGAPLGFDRPGPARMMALQAALLRGLAEIARRTPLEVEVRLAHEDPPHSLAPLVASLAGARFRPAPARLFWGRRADFAGLIASGRYQGALVDAVSTPLLQAAVCPVALFLALDEHRHGLDDETLAALAQRAFTGAPDPLLAWIERWARGALPSRARLDAPVMRRLVVRPGDARLCAGRVVARLLAARR